MGGIAENVGVFAHGGFWFLEWGILNDHLIFYSVTTLIIQSLPRPQDFWLPDTYHPKIWHNPTKIQGQGQP